MKKYSEIFGKLTFNKNAMRNKLSKSAYDKLLACIERNEAFDFSIADDVAHAMKEWALENGATHFTHWFQPQRGGTAEKHETFITYDENRDIIERFSGECLIRSEPDASSFPSGGDRSTFEARGYTAWDPTSPAFLLKAAETKTLVIPSVFLSYSGDVLDLKTPMLRSQRALNDSAIRLQKFLGNRFAKYTRVNVGAEQEYFLIPLDLYNKRLDLKICGRTLFGASPAKGQQMSDHYFGSINPEVLKFMEHLDLELYERGIPVKTRHNEVAPNQFELAPLYEESNLAVDHNLQVMDLIKKIAFEHGFAALLHEKPFENINGSGKHLNWSIGDNTGANYLEPSKSPLKNLTFLLTIAAILTGIDEYGELLRASIADAGNESRLGGNEAPPAIISVYLGSYLSNLLNDISDTGSFTNKKTSQINLGLQNLPKISKDMSDRNRTSPFAFTGNKFEFRAVGSNQNCAESLTIINTITAYGYDEIYNKLKKMNGDPKENAYKILKKIFNKTKRVIFDGNCYSDDWVLEAKKRKILNERNTPIAINIYLDESNIKLMQKYKILSKREIESKVRIKLENYINIKNIELHTSLKLINNNILPFLTKQINLLADTLNKIKSSGFDSDIFNKNLSVNIKLYETIQIKSKELSNILENISEEIDLNTQAKMYSLQGSVCLQELRIAVDEAEEIISDEYWILPKYQELLS